MKKKILILPLLLIFAIVLSKQVYAKVWTKDLVDSVTLDSGYKFKLCTIDFKYDFNSLKDAGFLSAEEKNFAANPDAYPCNKQSELDALLANITLNFSKKNWNGGSSPEKLLLLQDGLYSVGQYGDILAGGESAKAPISDISPVDWFSTLPAGISAIRGTSLTNTDPNAPVNKKTLDNSGMLILHDPKTGKFTGALFVINDVVYKVSSIISQVTQPTTLVDYTPTDIVSNTTAAPTETVTTNPTPQLDPNLSTYTNALYGYSFQYPKDFVINNSSPKDSASFLQKQDDLMAQRLIVMANQDPYNASLLSFAKKSGYDTSESKTITIGGREALLINKTFSLKDECGTNDEAQITRTKNLLIRSNGSILNFITDDSCSTFKTDWFSQIIPTIYFTN